MDWLSVANLLADSGDSPMMLLDGTGKIVLSNAAMEQLLGWSREEVVGRSWIDACMAPDRAQAAKRWLDQAFDGDMRKRDVELLTRDGRRLSSRVRLKLVGRRREPGLLMTVDSARPLDGADEQLSGRELDYEVSASLSDFGVIGRISAVGGALILGPSSPPRRRCFEVLYKRQSPCADCPVLLGARGTWPQTTVRFRSAGESYEVVTAQPDGADFVHLTVRIVGDRALRAIHRARVDSIAERAQLSERERTVLNNLLVGCSLDEIGAELGLSRRTVKFHQANVLQKLGVDSRVDLIRIIGFDAHPFTQDG
jgi:PAS domain S-box-containing protein